MQTRTWKPSRQASSVAVGRLTVRSVPLLAPRSRFVASVQACLPGPGTLPSSNGVNTPPVGISSEVKDVKTVQPHVSGFNWAPLWHVLKSISRVMAVAAVVVVLQNCLMPGQAMAAATAGAATQSSGGNVLASALDFVLHLDHHLSGLIEQHGKATYWLFFAIVFAETGLVLTPFLPGDSLLFAAGAFAGMGKLNVWTLMAVFITSAILGDAVNYAVGNRLGGWAAEKNLVKQEYIQKTEKFYAKYGGKTVVLARFVPIIRTFAPFVAGVGSMSYSNFAAYNVFGAVLWTVLFVGGGFFFGNLPFVQKNFTLVVLGIIVVSVVPVIIEIINARREGAAEQGTNNGKPL